MIDRKMTRSEFMHELMVRVMARVDIVKASREELDQAIRAVADEIGTEIKAYWAGRELDARRRNGERAQ